MEGVADVSRILIINCGSSSIKYEVYAMPQRVSLGKGLVERIGTAKANISQKTAKGNYSEDMIIPDHDEAMRQVATALTHPEFGALSDINEITIVGHRVVHGGEHYSASVIIDEEVIHAIEDTCELAPLHNPANLTGIRAAGSLLPGVKQVAVFDTAFHQTLSPAAYLYGLPRKLYDEYKIRRYGFHGTSHRFVAARAMQLIKRAPENTNVITCHLGNGASITAIEKGRSIDTSMGFTPLEGLMMGTRCGDLDPAITFFLLERGYTPEQLNKMYNKESGFLGLSLVGNDLRDLEKGAREGDKNCIETLDVYSYRIRKYIGAYAANLIKVDALIFTGGIGENGVLMRQRICKKLENLGIVMDYERNLSVGSGEGIISADYSPTTILVVPTNEELQIAIDSHELLYKTNRVERRMNSYEVNL